MDTNFISIRLIEKESFRLPSKWNFVSLQFFLWFDEKISNLNGILAQRETSCLHFIFQIKVCISYLFIFQSDCKFYLLFCRLPQYFVLFSDFFFFSWYALIDSILKLTTKSNVTITFVVTNSHGLLKLIMYRSKDNFLIQCLMAAQVLYKWRLLSTLFKWIIKNKIVSLLKFISFCFCSLFSSQPNGIPPNPMQEREKKIQV